MTTVSTHGAPAFDPQDAAARLQRHIVDTELKILATRVKDILDLRNVASHSPMSSTDLNAIDASKRGAIGLALQRGQVDMLSRQLQSWAIYFDGHINELVAVYEVLKDGEVTDLNATSIAYEMSSDILGALDRTILNRLPKAS